MRVLAVACVFVGLVSCAPPGPRLSDTTSELVAISPGNGGNFGEIPVGTISSPMTILVYPAGVGQSYDIITKITEACPNFSVSAPGLPAEVSKVCVGDEQPRVVGGGEQVAIPICGGYDVVDYAFTATFAPTIAGSQSCSINLELDSGPKSVTIMGTGKPPPREIELSRASLAFGDVRVATPSTPQSLVVSNTGSDTLTVTSATLTGTGAAAFTLVGNSGVQPIAGGQSYTYQLTCTPTEAVRISAALVIASDDLDEPMVSVPLTCAGVTSALNISPSPIALPTTRVDDPEELTVTLSNTGGAPMTGVTVRLTGAELEMVGTPPSGTIAAGASAPVRLRYLAKTEASIMGELTVEFDGNQVRKAEISATAKTAALSMDPDGVVDLGAICVGRSAGRIVTARAAGGGDFVITQAQPQGAGFALTNTRSPPYVLRGGGSSVELVLQATPASAGAMTGSMAITTDIPNSSVKRLELIATGIASGVGSVPAEFDFGSKLVNEPTDVQRFSLANCGSAPITISGATVEGPDAADFRVTEQPDTAAIAVGMNTLVRVEMRPRTEGTKTATLVVTHTMGQTLIPLSGDGFLPSQPLPDKGTYYSCSSAGRGGQAGGLLLLLLAAPLARRRRR